MDTNTRLLKAVQMATRKLVSSGQLDRLMPDVLAICVEAADATGGTIYVHDAAAHRLRFQHVLPENVADRLPFRDMPDDFGVAGRVYQTRRTEISDFRGKNDNSRAVIEDSTGIVIQTMITVPLMMEEEEPIGVVQLINKREGVFTESDMAVLDTVAAVSTMAYLNSRLVEESTRASSLLGMGKVSHDIGNLAANLFATISLSRFTLQDFKTNIVPELPPFRAAALTETLDEMFGELHRSIEQLVGYSRLISDLSAGRHPRPNKRLAALAPALRRAAAYLETDGLNNHVRLHVDVQEDAPPLLFDDLYMFRIVQNLVANGIKAVKETVPEGWSAQAAQQEDPCFGDVELRYRFRDDRHLIEVEDTGPGIPPEVVRRILAGTARSRWEKGSGSGWGMKIVLELADAHDGHVYIDSGVGRGTTVRLELPHQERFEAEEGRG